MVLVHDDEDNLIIKFDDVHLLPVPTVIFFYSGVSGAQFFFG